MKIQCTDEYDWTIHTDALFTVNYDNLPMLTFPDAEVEWFRAEWMGKRPASFQELYMVVVCNCIARSHPYTSSFSPSLINVYLIWGVIHSSQSDFVCVVLHWVAWESLNYAMKLQKSDKFADVIKCWLEWLEPFSPAFMSAYRGW